MAVLSSSFGNLHSEMFHKENSKPDMLNILMLKPNLQGDGTRKVESLENNGGLRVKLSRMRSMTLVRSGDTNVVHHVKKSEKIHSIKWKARFYQLGMCHPLFLGSLAFRTMRTKLVFYKCKSWAFSYSSVTV